MVEKDNSGLDSNVKAYVANEFSETARYDSSRQFDLSQQIDHAMFKEWSEHQVSSDKIRLTDGPSGKQLVAEQTFPDGSTMLDITKVDAIEPLKTSTWDAKLTMPNGTVVEMKQEDGHAPLMTTISLAAGASPESMAFITRPLCAPGEGSDGYLLGEAKPYYVARGSGNSRDLLFVEKPYGEKKLPDCSTLPNVFTLHKVKD
jgi:hypothetical protein